MKASKYNFFTAASEGKRIAFNGVSCALAEIDEEYFHEYGLIERGEESKSTLDSIRYNLEGMLGILAYKYENLVKKEVK